MAPDGFAGFIAFLLFVAPGALYHLVLARRQPLLKTTTFAEVNRVVLVSVSSWLVAALVAGNVGYADDGVWLQAAIAGTRPAALAADPTVGEPMLMLAAFAIVLAAGTARLRTRGQAGFVEGTMWYQVLRAGRPPGSRAWVWVTLDDDTVVGGFLAAADYRDVAIGERELVIRGPVQVRGPGMATPVTSSEHLLLLSGDTIRSISVNYVR